MENLNQTSQAQTAQTATSTSSLITMTRHASAPEGTAEALILRGKFIATELIGAKTKISPIDNKTKFYTGDLVLSSQLPSVAVSSYLPPSLNLSPDNLSQIDNILQQEQGRKLRLKVESNSLSFGDSFSFQPQEFSINSVFSSERTRADTLTADAIRALFNSREFIQPAALFYSSNLISSTGAAAGEKLIISVLRSAAAQPCDLWLKLADRFNSILALANAPSNQFQLSAAQQETAAAILAKLTNAAQPRESVSDSIF